MTNLNRVSEFTVHEYGSNGAAVATTWRWVQGGDDRAQSLFHDGALPPDLALEFVELVNRSHVWVTDDDAVYLMPPGEGGTPHDAVEASLEAKQSALDNFLFIARASRGVLHDTPTPDDPAYWAAHRYQPVTDVELIDEAAYAELMRSAAAAADVAARDAAKSFLAKAQAAWDAKAARYVKLGWSEADCIDEFGARPAEVAQ